MTMARSLFATGCAAACALAVFAAPALPETVIGSNVESRVILAFKVDDAAAQARLPEGWQTLTLPQGPLAGANELVVFIDRHLRMDAEGKPATPYASRSVALVSFGVSPDAAGPRTFVTRVYETVPIADSYGNGAAATIRRELSLEDADDGREHEETWSVEPETGGQMTLKLKYDAGRPGWQKGQESQPYSAARPEFHRIYRYDQLVDLAMSDALGKPLDGEIEFAAEIAEMSGYDGSETLKALLVVPVYVREVSLP